MKLETIALAAVVAYGIIWLLVTITGVLVAVPFGLIGLIPIAIVVGLLVAVLRERLNNKEDDYYTRNVDK